MKFISLGKINKKIFLLLFIYIIIISLNNSIISLIKSEEKYQIGNIILRYIINFSSFLLYILPEYIIKKKSSISVKKDKQKQKQENGNNRVVYLYSNTSKKMSLKNYLILFLIFLLHYILIIFGPEIYLIIYGDKFKIFSNEFIVPISLLFLYLIFRILHKMNFYKHQYLSFLIIFFFDLMKFLVFIFAIKIKEINFNLSYDLLYLIPLIIYVLIGSIQIYLIKRYLYNKYFSPFFVIFIEGIVFEIISIILLPIFLNVECGKDLQPILCEMKSVSSLAIILNIFQGILVSIKEFLRIKILDDFTVFHIMILDSIGILVDDIYSLISDYNTPQLILSIFTFLITILFLSIFIEIIELNFCGLNFNLKKNITRRAVVEKDKIYDINNINEDEDEDNNSEIILNNDKKDEDIYSVY